MVIEKTPFRATHIWEEEKKEKPDTFTVRLNMEERQWLEEIKEDLNIANDSSALKYSAFIGKNVLHTLFSRPLLRYLFKKERVKLENYKSF